MRYLLILLSLNTYGQIFNLSVLSKSTPVRDSVSVQDFGAIADFAQCTCSVSGSTITVSGYSLTQSDVGKAISVFDSHINASYSGKIVSKTSLIKSVSDATHLTVLETPNQTISGKKCYIGTNNFNAIQAALNYCYTHGSSKLGIPSGTYYVVPTLSTLCPQQGAVKGLQINGDLEIIGAGSLVTKLKFGSEDISEVLDARVLQYVGFYFKGNGNRNLHGFSMVGADRTTTATVNLYNTAIYTDQVANVSMTNTFSDFKVTGLDGWGKGFSSSRGGTAVGETVTDWYVTEMDSVIIEARLNPLDYFSQDGATKEINLTNVVLHGGGGLPMPTKAGTISGTILTISDTDFSFYDLRSQNSSTDRKYFIVAGAFTANITSIISPTVATIDASTTYSGNVEFRYSVGVVSENHTVYMHPNVTYRWENVDLVGSRKLSFRTFSGGGQTGIPLRQQMINVNEYRDLTLASSGGCEFMTNLTTPIEWTDCDFGLSQSDIYNITATGTNIKSGQMYGDISFTNCTGYIDHVGIGRTVTLTGGVFTQVVPRGSGSSYTITNSEAPNVLFYSTPIAAFSWNSNYIGYFSFLSGIDPIAMPTINISNITARGNVIGFPLFNFQPGYTAQQKTDIQSKFHFTNCTFDTN